MLLNEEFVIKLLFLVVVPVEDKDGVIKLCSAELGGVNWL